MQLDKEEVNRFVNKRRTPAAKAKAKFLVLSKRRATGMDLTINFKQAKKMVKNDNYWMEVE